MRIAIDISQIVYEGTGVAAYVRNLITALVEKDSHNDYILFGASLRKRAVFGLFAASLTTHSKRVRLVTTPIPPTLLDIVWNRLHIIPAEWFVGPVDIFWSSDWTQPPLTHARGITTIHDLSILRYPGQSHNKAELDYVHGRLLANIVAVQTRRLRRASKECQAFFCDSEATKKDAHTLLGIANDRLRVIYPGM